jgi:hypothetical protein
MEIWFARVEREAITQSIFTAVRDLARKLMRYIRAYSKTVQMESCPVVVWRPLSGAGAFTCDILRWE